MAKLGGKRRDVGSLNPKIKNLDNSFISKYKDIEVTNITPTNEDVGEEECQMETKTNDKMMLTTHMPNTIDATQMIDKEENYFGGDT